MAAGAQTTIRPRRDRPLDGATSDRAALPITYEAIAPPGPRAMLQELRLPLDAMRWAPQSLSLVRRRATTRRTLMLLPGFGAGPRSMWLMGRYLRLMGHDVNDWGLGKNTGNVRALLKMVAARLDQLAQRSAAPVDLVGWSLGGYLGRETARDNPASVRKVITLGSPVVGGPSFTAVAPWYRARGHDLSRIEREVADRFATPLQAPVAAVYSRRDGVVAWRACIDHWSPRVRHIEVSETHLGMGFAPRVLSIIASELDSD